MKYIADRNTIIIFPKNIAHEEMAESLKMKVESAGFIKGLDPEKIECCGESISLRIKSKPEDTEKLRNRIIQGY